MKGDGCSPHLGEPRRFIIETTCPIHGFDAWPTLGVISMRLMILESPYAGQVERNTNYARAAVRDAIKRDEAPIASHLLFTQPGILDDAVPAERQKGIDAGLAWYAGADGAAFYLDHGMSSGMRGAWDFLQAHRPDLHTEFRFMAPPIPAAQAARFEWQAPFLATTVLHTIAEMPLGVLEVNRAKRPPTPTAVHEVRFNARSVAHYHNHFDAITAAEHFYLWLESHAGGFAWPQGESRWKVRKP